MPADSRFLTSRWFLCLLFAVAVVGVIGFQMTSGAWASDLGGDPDEPAHAVTSLMVRDYLAGGLGQNPLAFAQRYYEDFPKVALGHYPPGYYALAGVWMLPWAAPQALFALQALFAGCLAVLVFRAALRLRLNPVAAVFAALLVILVPVTLKLTQQVMADLMLTCLCLMAVEAWARFMEQPRAGRALLFGALAAAAILTKGSGLALALVPAVAVLLTGRWALLKTVSFWLAGVPVALLAGPWMLYSTKITQEGMVKVGAVQYFTKGLAFYTRAAGWTFGWLMLALTVAGLILVISRGRKAGQVDLRIASLLGLLAGTLAVMLLVPAGYSSRYFMPIVPVMVLLALSVVDLLQQPWRPWGLAGLLVVTLGLTKGGEMKQVQGFNRAVDQALQESAATPRRWLVSSDPRGEGAIIAAGAFASEQRAPSSLRIHRASKELGSTDWLGRDYQGAFATPAELLAHLDKRGITQVFVDLSVPEKLTPPHEALLLQALRGDAARWALAHEEPVQRQLKTPLANLQIYRRLPIP